jgi:hypothetical protein
MFKTICYFVLLYLEIPKNVCNCSRLISVGSCYLLYMLALYVLTVSSCGWVRNGVENLRGTCFSIKYKSIIYSNKCITLYSVYNIGIILGLTLLLCCSSILVCWVVFRLRLLACPKYSISSAVYRVCVCVCVYDRFEELYTNLIC